MIIRFFAHVVFSKSQICDTFDLPSPDSFSTFEAKYQYPSIEQLSEALEDPLCLSEDLLSDTKPNTSNQLKNRIAQLSVITQ